MLYISVRKFSAATAVYLAGMKRNRFFLSLAALLAAPATAVIVAAKNTSRTLKGFVVKDGDGRAGRRYRMKGVTLNLLDPKITAGDTGGQMAVFQQTGLTPNGGPPLHLHHYQDEWFYIIEGDYCFEVGGERYSLGAGDTIFLPRKVPHAIIQLSEKGKVIVCYQPAGKIEAFFAQTDKWEHPPTPQEVAQLFAACDMKVTGAPLKP